MKEKVRFEIEIGMLGKRKRGNIHMSETIAFLFDYSFTFSLNGGIKTVTGSLKRRRVNRFGFYDAKGRKRGMIQKELRPTFK